MGCCMKCPPERSVLFSSVMMTKHNPPTIQLHVLILIIALSIFAYACLDKSPSLNRAAAQPITIKSLFSSSRTEFFRQCEIIHTNRFSSQLDYNANEKQSLAILLGALQAKALVCDSFEPNLIIIITT